jgi:thymidine kinase
MSIRVIFGPMFSGKTTELLRRVRRFSVARKLCILVKHAADTRYSGVSTHDACPPRSGASDGRDSPLRGNIVSQDWVSVVRASALADVEAEVAKADVIGIDEGQFFPDIVSFCERMANRGKIVIVAALDGTFQRKPFGDVLGLVPLAESVVKLNAVCMTCLQDAAFSARLSSEEEVVVVGGAEKYVAVCRNCRVQAPV